MAMANLTSANLTIPVFKQKDVLVGICDEYHRMVQNGAKSSTNLIMIVPVALVAFGKTRGNNFVTFAKCIGVVVSLVALCLDTGYFSTTIACAPESNYHSTILEAVTALLGKFSAWRWGTWEVWVGLEGEKEELGVRTRWGVVRAVLVSFGEMLVEWAGMLVAWWKKVRREDAVPAVSARTEGRVVSGSEVEHAGSMRHR